MILAYYYIVSLRTVQHHVIFYYEVVTQLLTNRLFNVKGIVHTPDNYRGLQLTPVLSKVAPRVITILFGNYIAAIYGFGASQWAFGVHIPGPYS